MRFARKSCMRRMKSNSTAYLGCDPRRRFPEPVVQRALQRYRSLSVAVFVSTFASGCQVYLLYSPDNLPRTTLSLGAVRTIKQPQYTIAGKSRPAPLFCRPTDLYILFRIDFL